MNRTEGIIDRFPHFFHAKERYSNLYRFVEVFSGLLDGSEDDLRRVRNAHFVNKANNKESKGFDSNQKGDLDSIFSLYLEALGGTSLLKQANRPPDLEPGFARWLQLVLLKLNREVEEGSLTPTVEGVIGFLQAEVILDHTYEIEVEEIITLLQQESQDYLTAVGLIEQRLRPDEVYRERIKGLIQVLLRGASTKQGIIDVVAANLGIVGNSPAAIEAKSAIEIREYMPRVVGNPQPFVVRPFQVLTFTNPNPFPSSAEIQVSVHEDFKLPVSRVRFRQLVGSQSFGFTGSLSRTASQVELLTFLPNGRIRKGSDLLPPEALEGAIPQLPPGNSNWIVEVYTFLPPAKFEPTPPIHESCFDYSVFDDDAGIEAVESLQGSSLDQINALNIVVNILTNRPASFTVVVPWDIPGFTEKLDTLSDQPRFQIPFIVDKVKAAGVYAEVEYVKRLYDDHQLVDTLLQNWQYEEGSQRLAEGGTGPEGGLDIQTVQSPTQIVHEITDQDSIIHHAVFDYTYFDSDNRFS
ncbi:MAG: hypothetical protein AAF388_00080 [Bacteroidota bacterium]